MVTLNSFLRVFGCICFVLRPSVECNKLSLCSTICVFLGYGEGQRVIVIMILLLKSYIFLVMSSSLSVFFSSLFLPSVIPCQSLILSALTLSLMILLTLYPLLSHPYHIMFPLLSLTYLLQATTNNGTRDIFYAPLSTDDASMSPPLIILALSVIANPFISLYLKRICKSTQLLDFAYSCYSLSFTSFLASFHNLCEPTT